MEYGVAIGLEVHCQLKCRSKIFCACPIRFGTPPNTQVCPVCLGLPGVLPVLNKKAVELAILAAIALNCKINRMSKFHRKNYFYPDLPKSYQISQYDEPLAEDGYLEIGRKRIGITRVHLEEDAGKLIHYEDSSVVDFNRCGVPLIEIVSSAEIESPKEAKEYLENLKSILQYIDVSDCNMEEGSLRCDVNVSIIGEGEKVEIKNINSFKFVERALAYEIDRQKEVLKRGGKVFQETRLFDERSQKTFPMRRKEIASDYRYFPEPDLLPLVIEEEQIERLKGLLPELPRERMKRFVKDYMIPEYDARILTSERELADFFEECLKYYRKPKSLSNWIMTELLALLSEAKKQIEECLVKPKQLGEMLEMVDDGTISRKIAKEVFSEMFTTGKAPKEIVKEKGLLQIKDEDELKKVVDIIISQNPDAVKDYRDGKKKAFGFLVGQIMRETKGRANPQMVNQILKERLAI
jgi:aspartyl-tRNA(Asn)/glutamyl-tRNA(Gln) amidotransferase subunit B